MESHKALRPSFLFLASVVFALQASGLVDHLPYSIMDYNGAVSYLHLHRWPLRADCRGLPSPLPSTFLDGCLARRRCFGLWPPAPSTVFASANAPSCRMQSLSLSVLQNSSYGNAPTTYKFTTKELGHPRRRTFLQCFPLLQQLCLCSQKIFVQLPLLMNTTNTSSNAKKFLASGMLLWFIELTNQRPVKTVGKAVNEHRDFIFG